MKVRCPSCGGLNTEWIDLRSEGGPISVMCWTPCGMDFDVNGVWFMLNRCGDEE